MQWALEYRGRCGLGAEFGDDGADVAQAGEYAVQLRLVGDLDGDRGGSVVVAGHVETAEPGRPVVVEVALDADRVGRRRGVHESAPAGCGPVDRVRRRRAGRRMAHSATARLIAQPAPLARSPASTPVPKIALADALGEDLGAGAQADRVGPQHPRAVGGDVAATNGGDGEHEAGGQRGREDQAEHEQQLAGAGLRVVEQRQPERRGSHEQPGHADRPAGATVPDRVPGAKPRCELRDRAEGEDRGADDVHHERDREAGEPLVGGDDGRAAGELDEPQRPGRQRDGAQRDQRRPAPATCAPWCSSGDRLRDPRGRRRVGGRRPVGARCATARRRGRSARRPWAPRTGG